MKRLATEAEKILNAVEQLDAKAAKELQTLEREAKKRTDRQLARHTFDLKYRKAKDKASLEKEKSALENNYLESEKRFHELLDNLEY